MWFTDEKKITGNWRKKFIIKTFHVDYMYVFFTNLFAKFKFITTCSHVNSQFPYSSESCVIILKQFFNTKF